ncbi:MAG: ATP-binding domain-containing protein, partial [Mycobacterium sp.]|nr:ATP-binding domain-containing protein [Mycobacterium sp.]
FTSWGHVQEYVDKEAEGADLKAFVTVIDDHGADVVIAAMNQLAPEHRADVTVSTAHKAKGREWNTVRVATDFDPPGDDPKTGDPQPIRRDEAMLAYVTVTRAKRHLDHAGLSWIDNHLEDHA